MRFQLIVEGGYRTDQEFEELMETLLGRYLDEGGDYLKITEARSLEGLKDEVWKRKPKQETAEDLI